MKNIIVILVLIAAFAAPIVHAQTFAFAGHLDDGDRPADGLFTFELSLLNDADVVLWSEQQDNVIVAAGVFALEVGASTPLPASLPGRARLAIVVDDDALAPMPLAQLLSVTRAVRATTATSATSATSVGGVTAAAAATREALSAAGGPPVAFGNVTGVPATVLDGDSGVDVTSTSADLSISARTLNIATVAGTRLATGAVDGAGTGAGSTTSAVVADGAVTGAKIADGTLTRSRISGALGVRELKTAEVFIIDPACNQAGELTTTKTCSGRGCDRGPLFGAGRLVCGQAQLCGPTGNGSNCGSNTPAIGELVLE